MTTAIHTHLELSNDRMQAAYQACLAEIMSVPEAGLLPVTLDIVAITTRLAGILPGLQALRGQIEATWRDFDVARFDKLEQYALALLQTHGACNSTLTPKVDVAKTAAALTRVRDQLYAVALPLPGYGLLSNSALDRCKVGIGYRALIGDVITLVSVFRQDWAALAGKVPFTEDTLLHAKELALELQEQLGRKEHAPVINADAALLRQKAFTLFIRTYQEARRAVVYLRAAKGDADEIAPSFYALRTGKRRPQEADVGANAPAMAATLQPISVDPNGADTPALPLVIDNAAGLPMDNPFVS